jgi:hypothetical protein
LLALAVVLGRLAFADSVIDMLGPEAFHSRGPDIALASAAGLFTTFVLTA